MNIEDVEAEVLKEIEKISKAPKEEGELIPDDECHCVQFSSIPDEFCEDCLGTGHVICTETYKKKYNF